MSSDGIRGVIQEEFLRLLADPVNLPSEFKNWVPTWTETVGIVVPRSQVTGAYTTGEDVSDLGEPAHGRPVMLRVGSSPYTYIQLVYDDVYGKWVSAHIWQFSIDNFTATNTTGYEDLSDGTAARTHLPNFKAVYDAGLTPQLHVAASLDATSVSDPVKVRPAIYQFNDADTSLEKIAHGPEISTSSTTRNWKISAWADTTFDSAPTENHAYMSAQVFQENIVSAAIFDTSIQLRWVADPA